MSGVLQRHPGTGKLLHGPTGLLVSGCTSIFALFKLTPCHDIGSDCMHCDADTTPTVWQVTLAGLDAALCVGCIRSEATRSADVISSALDGTYTLSQTTSCIWKIAGVGAWAADMYDTEDCTGAIDPDFDRTGTVDITLTRTAAEWALQVRSVGFPSWRAFNGTSAESANGNCDTIAIMSNDFTECSMLGLASPRLEVNPGGTAMFAPGDLAGRCPGGDPYYTNTDLAAYDGKTIEISEDPGICYQVATNTDEEVSDGNATKTNCWTTCQKCCVPDADDC